MVNRKHGTKMKGRQLSTLLFPCVNQRLDVYNAKITSFVSAKANFASIIN